MGASQFWLLQRTPIPNNLSSMQISLEGEIGICLGLLAILGTGAIMIYPTRLWIGRTMIATAVAGLFLLGFQHFGIWRLRTPAAAMIISATAFLLCTIWYFWPTGGDSQQADEVAASVVDNNQKHPENTLLPPNAKFRYKGKIFWAISRPYTKDENSDIRIALREIYDCINSHSEPIITNYDGPAIMFTREWISIIEKQGATSAIQKLTEIRTKVRLAATKLQSFKTLLSKDRISVTK